MDDPPKAYAAQVAVRIFSEILRSSSYISKLKVTVEIGAAVIKMRAQFASGEAHSLSQEGESCRERFGLTTPTEFFKFRERADSLVLYQKVPPEREIDVCGAVKRRIRRGSPEFNTLVQCVGPNIKFKDEEGTSADRMMTNSLRRALETLAEATRVEWGDARLRVTEAWDEDGEHHGESLHYEGRAADLTTFPIDDSKLGRLARLAVEAGFDWVYYEDKKHVHVSVRSD